MVKRDLKNVQDDLRLLEQYGLVEMNHGKGTGKRRVRVPRTKVEQIALKITI
jgi:predicted transcriptional regulator